MIMNKALVVDSTIAKSQFTQCFIQIQSTLSILCRKLYAFVQFLVAFIKKVAWSLYARFRC